MPSGELLLLLALHLALTALPLSAAALLAARAGVRSLPLLLAIGLGASALIGFVSFWAYYGGRGLGETLSYFVALGSIGAIVWALRGGGIERRLLAGLAVPLGLWALGSVFLVFLGFAHGGASEPLMTALTRFSHPLPSDNQIPFFYAEWFFENGHRGDAPVFPGEWLSSDRPPLQVGYVLSQRPFSLGDNQLSYQVLSVVLQQMWILGLWALLVAAGARRLTRGLVLIAVVVSDLAILNGFFVWPKMLPVALLLALTALIVTPLWERVRQNLWGAALAAALAALAMLSHGSSVFAVLPLALIAAFRGLPSWRWIAVGLGVGIVLMGSWSAYQKHGDPPGNRLVKWTLAGEPAIDDRGSLETIVDAYSEAGLGTALAYKRENFRTMLGRDAIEATTEAALDGELNMAARGARSIQFFNLVPSLGLLLLGPVLMAVGWRRRDQSRAEWNLAIACFTIFVAGAVIWGLLVFGNEIDRTLKHIGSYLVPMLGIVGCVVGMRAVFPRFALYYVGAASLLSLALYAPALDPPPGTSYSVVAFLLAAIALVGYVYLALRDRVEPEGESLEGLAAPAESRS